MLGYDKGKQTMINKKTITEHTLSNGQNGYKIETVNHFAIGNKVSLKLENTAIVKPDYAMVELTAREEKNKKVTTYKAVRSGDKVNIESIDPNGKSRSKSLDWKGPLYINNHPRLYAKELVEPGAEKIYPVLLASQGRVDRYKVTYVGPAKFTENNQTYKSRHFRIHPLTKPGEAG